MKKFIKNNILGFILGAIIFGGGVYAATLLDSKDVTYTPSDSSFNVSNVNGALDELYTKISEHVTFEKIYDFSQGIPYDNGGTPSRATSFTVDVKSLYPDTYQNYTTDNFLFVRTQIYTFCDNNNSSEYKIGATMELSYNAETGILTVSGIGKDNGSGDDVEVATTTGYVLLVN